MKKITMVICAIALASFVAVSCNNTKKADSAAAPVTETTEAPAADTTTDAAATDTTTEAAADTTTDAAATDTTTETAAN